METYQDVDLLVFPEAALSGYVTDKNKLKELDFDQINAYMNEIKDLAINTQASIWLGSILKKEIYGSESNAEYTMSAIGFSYKGDIFRYDKINLATKERGVFSPGNELKSFRVPINTELETMVKISPFLCRELKYPEMWRLMAKDGVDCFIHLNNAVADSNLPSEEFSVWKSQLIARASENQRYVLSVNTSASYLKSPTIAIDPKGQILTELGIENYVSEQIKINTTKVSNWYIDQMRDDLIELKWSN